MSNTTDNNEEVKYDYQNLNDMMTSLKAYAVLPDNQVVSIVRHLLAFLKKEFDHRDSFKQEVIITEQAKVFKLFDKISASEKQLFISTTLGKEVITYEINCKKTITKK